MNGSSMPPQSATPTPEEEKNPEYLKELQAEKDSLESAYAAAMASATSGQQSSEAENSSDPDSAASKTNHAIKLLEQGRKIDFLGWVPPFQPNYIYCLFATCDQEVVKQ